MKCSKDKNIMIKILTMKSNVIFCILLIFCGCQKSVFPTLEGTEWQCNIAEGCIDYYHFLPDSNFVSYNCEADYKSYGKYFVQNDTLFIYEFAYDSDSLLSQSDGYYGLGKSMYKIVLESGKLKHVGKWSYIDEEGKWLKDDFIFDENYIFDRVK